MIRLAVAPAALAGLAVARLLPETGVGLYLRLAAATALVLVPGLLVSSALGRRGAAPTAAWTLASLFVAAAVTFLVGGSVAVTLAALAVIALAAAPFAVRGELEQAPRGSLIALAAGTVLGIALWRVAGAVAGDGLFHLARVRKLAELDSLSLDSVN